MTDESTQTGHKAGAKLCSRLAMAFSSAWIAALTVCKGAGVIDLDVDEIIILRRGYRGDMVPDIYGLSCLILFCEHSL